MIIVDANIPLYAYDQASTHHNVARTWFTQALAGPELVAFPLVTLLAFVRITTNPRLIDRPKSTAQAIAIVESWLDRPSACTVGPTERHFRLLSSVATDGQARGPMVTDAHLAALAIEHGATLCSADRDFTRFPGVRLFNPLAD